MARKRGLVGAALMLLGVSACIGGTAPDNAAVCSAFAAGRSRVEVVAQGPIVRVLGTRMGRVSPHEGFLMRVRATCNLVVRVEANTDFTGAIPLRAGQVVQVKGEYEYYPRGGVIHWTHHDPRFHHIGGYVEAGGNTYE